MVAIGCQAASNAGAADEDLVIEVIERPDLEVMHPIRGRGARPP